MALNLRFLAGIAGLNARDFASGWYEGQLRAKEMNTPDVIPASLFTPGTVAFAASQAAVAFSLGMEGR